MALSNKITITVTEVILIQVYFLTVGSKHKNKNEYIEFHGIFIPCKSQFYSKHFESHFDGGWNMFVVMESVWSWSNLVLYLHVWVTAKFF